MTRFAPARVGRESRVFPGKDAERPRVGLDLEVALLDPDEPLDRGAVESLPVAEGRFELGAGKGEIHRPSQDVGEDDPDELDLPGRVEDGPQDFVLVGEAPGSWACDRRWLSCALLQDRHMEEFIKKNDTNVNIVQINT